MKLFKKLVFVFCLVLVLFLVGCKENQISNFSLEVDKVFATSVTLKESNDFLYKDKLTVTLYKDNKTVKTLEDFTQITDLEPNTTYVIKYTYFNGSNEITREVYFKTLKVDEINLSIDILNATSVIIKDDNKGFLYKDGLKISLYKNNELIKDIEDYKNISNLEADTEYVLKYQYHNGLETINKEVKFKTKLIEELDLSVDEISYDYIKLKLDKQSTYLDTLNIKVYEGDKLVLSQSNYESINDLVVNTEYKIVYEYFNGDKLVTKEIETNTKKYNVLNEDKKLVIDIMKGQISHLKVTLNDSVLFDGDTTNAKYVIENLKMTDKIEYTINYMAAESSHTETYNIDLEYSSYFVETFKYHKKFYGLVNPLEKELIFNNAVVLDGNLVIINSIEKDLFMNNNTIETLKINNILNISDNAFNNCDNLKSIDFKGMLSIGKRAFYDCDKLETINFGNSYIRFNEEVFSSCDSLKTVDLRNCNYNNEIIDEEAERTFSYPFKRVFGNCENLEAVYLEPGLMPYEYMFEGCSKLNKVVNIGTLKIIPRGAFKDCVNLENVVIHSNCVIIQVEAFANCAKVKEVFIGKDCIIVKAAFAGCSELVIKTDASTRPEKWYDGFAPDDCEIKYNQTRS